MRRSINSTLFITLLISVLMASCSNSAVQPDDKAKSKNPLSAFAEYDLGMNGTFAKSHRTDDQTYFKWKSALDAQLPEGYRIPTFKEMCVILPARQLFWPRPTDLKTTGEEVTIEGKEGSYAAEYYGKGDKVIYAIRFIDEKGDNQHRTAFKYEFKDEGSLNARMVVTTRYIGNVPGITMEKVMAANFFEEGAKENIVTRIFPLAGYSDGLSGHEGHYSNVGSKVVDGTHKGYWWSATLHHEGEDPMAYSMQVTKLSAQMSWDRSDVIAQMVRPIRK